MILNLPVPPYPLFITSGTTTYYPGTGHESRSNVGVFDLIFVEYGELYLTDNEMDYVLRTGDYLILDPAGKHYSRRLVDQKTQFHWIHFQTQAEWSFSQKADRPRSKAFSFWNSKQDILNIPKFQHLSSMAQERFLNLHRFMPTTTLDYQRKKYVLTDSKQCSPLRSEILLLELLELIEIRHEQPVTNQSLAEKIMEYLETYYDREITLKMLSDNFSFHPAHILRQFKARYDMTVIDALNKIRISRARELLSSESTSVKEIAEKVGFSSVSYFDRVFRKETGQSPKAYRDQAGETEH